MKAKPLGASGDSMSRFHDEFFRQGSPDHDKLMIKCTSEKGIQQIISQIDMEKHKGLAINSLTCDWDRQITICQLKEGRTAWRGIYEGYNSDKVPQISEDYRTQKKYCMLAYRNKCEHVEQCTLSEGNEPVTSNVVFSYQEEKTTKHYETEVICKNRDFIIGYADAVIKTTYEGKIDAIIDKDWTWKKFHDYKVEVDILIEAKPMLTSIGEVIRQLKTYKSILERHKEYPIPMVPVITTYSKPEPDAIEYIKNEGIYVVTFE